jgi:hypothetical protein
MIAKMKNGSLGSVLLPTFRIEADAFSCGMELLITNVVGIAELSECKIVLMMKHEKVKILGKCLEVSIYERNTVEIRGSVYVVERVGFAPRKEERNARD